MNSNGVFQSVVLLLAITILAGSLIYLQSHSVDQMNTGQTAAKTTELILKFDNYRHSLDKETTKLLADRIATTCSLPNPFNPIYSTSSSLCNRIAITSSFDALDTYTITVDIRCTDNQLTIKKQVKFEKTANANNAGGPCQIQITDNQSDNIEYP